MERFEVFERLGAGGMGEVFRARDRKLNRFVALKFLPVGSGATARERFEREAQAIAALNHPHICTLYETGEEGDRPFLVLELLEGETLQARLARGPLAGEALIEAALEIAEALEAAHKHGILHRDLKPANIWVLPGGHVKVLDFGLARLTGDALSDAATIAGSALATSPGVAVGTAPYMSPEQARGEAVDARSDLFSFGAVLYEMATGKAAFARPSAAETAAAILAGQPPLLQQLPPELGRIVARCLEKDPDLRYQSAADLRSDLKRLKRSSTSSISAVTPAALPPPGHARRWGWIAAAAVILIAGGLAWWRQRAAPAPPPTLTFRQLTFSADVADAAISADGRFLAEVHVDPAGTSLHLLSIASGSDVQIVPPGNGCCLDPTIAPDDSAVYFLANNNLQSVPVLGGPVRRVADHTCSGAGFSLDGGQIAYLTVNARNHSELVLARPDGTQARVVASAPAGYEFDGQCWADQYNPAAPVWSSDGRHIALALGTSTVPTLGVVDVTTGSTQVAPLHGFVGFSNLAWLPGGGALVTTSAMASAAAPQLWRIPWPEGPPHPLTSDLQGYSRVSAAANGSLTLLHSLPQASIWVQARAGGPFAQLPGGGANLDGRIGIAWTPSGQLLSARSYGTSAQLWLQNADGSDARALNLGEAPSASYPVAAPNGDIVFASRENDLFRLWRLNPSGGGATPLIPPDPSAWSGGLLDGGAAVVYIHGDDRMQALWTVPLAGGAPRQLWDGYIFTTGGNPISPDGRRLFVIARTSNGQRAARVLTVGADHQITAAPLALDLNTMLPRYAWTPDGRAITYVHRQGSVANIWAFPLDGSKPYPLTHFTELDMGAYAFSRDGRLAVSRGSRNTDVVLVTGLGKK